MSVLRCSIVLVLFLNIVLCSEVMLDDEVVVMDGIRVRKDSIRNETNEFDNSNTGKRQREDESGSEEGDDVIEDQDDDDDDDEDDEDVDYDDEEDLETTKYLPTKCHGRLKFC